MPAVEPIDGIPDPETDSQRIVGLLQSLDAKIGEILQIMRLEFEQIDSTDMSADGDD